MKRRKLVGVRVAIVVISILLVGLSVASVLQSIPVVNSATIGKIPEAAGWRLQLYLRKAWGDIPELSWSELFHMTLAGAGFSLKPMVTDGTSVDAAIGLSPPKMTNDDRRSGERIFRERCVGCHGDAGRGDLHGPTLTGQHLKHGDSSFSIYKALRDGIDGTPMAPADLPQWERWQVVAYIRMLRLKSASAESTTMPKLNINVSTRRIQAAGAKTDEWVTYSGSLNGWRYSSLNEITPANVSRLKLRWMHQFETDDMVFEATPLVVNNVIFTVVPPATVVALDAKTGAEIWQYKRNIPARLPLCCGRINRGLAILGRTLFLDTLDDYLVATDANTGTMMWETRVASPSEGFSMTGAPLIAGNSVIVGVAGGEFGIRGFLASYNAETGKQEWKFDTIPGPSETGHETWKNDAWKTGGGPTWVTGSYDPSLGLIYWGVGNASPDYVGEVRPGDNLFTDSVIALHASNGKLAWYFQFTPHDEHDWDSNQTPILADAIINGQSRKVICWANRNGFYYVLDRTTGEFLIGTPFVEQNWTKGLDSAGRPMPPATGDVHGRLTKPAVAGGTNWQNPAYDPEKGWIFVPATEGEAVYTKSRSDKVRRGQEGLYLGSAGSETTPLRPVVRALEAATGIKKWEYFSPPLTTGGYGGLLVTAGGLVFGGSGGVAFAVDAATGRELWRVPLGGETRAAPISFTVDGHQVILVTAGRALLMFALTPLQ